MEGRKKSHTNFCVRGGGCFRVFSCLAAHPSSGSPHLAFLSLCCCVKRDKCVASYFPQDPAAPSFLQLWVKISRSPVVLIHPLGVNRGAFSSHSNFQKSEGLQLPKCTLNFNLKVICCMVIDLSSVECTSLKGTLF